MYKYPLQEMTFPNAPYDARAHGWRIEHDRFIAVKMEQLGYGQWNDLRLAILKHPGFKFDFFIRSRTNNDINKRMRQLRPSIEREFGQHIRIFDRKKTKKDLQKREQYIQDRLQNHLNKLSQEITVKNNIKRKTE